MRKGFFGGETLLVKLWRAGVGVPITIIWGKDFKHKTDHCSSQYINSMLLCMKPLELKHVWLHKSWDFPLSMSYKKKSCISDVESCWHSLFCLLFLLSTSKEAERNNTQVDSLLLNPKRLYHCYSSKNHQCWQFSSCFSLVELYISLFARRDSSSTNNPAWQTCRCWRQIGVLYS